MTKANILKKFFKEFYNLDLTGMTVTQVIKQFYKEMYDFDSSANSFVSVIGEAIDNGLAPAGGGSGGDDGTMVVRCEGETDTGNVLLLKTWQEMYDSYNDGEMIIIVDPFNGPQEVQEVASSRKLGSEGLVYFVITLGGLSYDTSSPTGNPCHHVSDDPEA